MSLVRIVVPVGILLSLVAIVLQNQTPAIALIFLGTQLPPLPLGLLMVAGGVLGAILGLLLRVLLEVATITTPRQPQSRTRRRSPSATQATSQPRDWGTQTADPDWDVDAETVSDWGDKTTSQGDKASIPPDWQRVVEQRAESQAGAVPSASSDAQDRLGVGRKERSFSSSDPSAADPFRYRDPRFSGKTGQKGSVFDAEYRVLMPPNRSSEPRQDPLDDFDDEFFNE